MTRETSIEAYRQMAASGLLSERRLQTFQILAEHGPMTGSEAARFFARPADRGATVARCGELRDMGVVREVGERDCSVTGKSVLVWEVIAGVLPLKLARGVRVTRKQHIARLEQDGLRLREALRVAADRLGNDLVSASDDQAGVIDSIRNPLLAELEMRP